MRRQTIINASSRAELEAKLDAFVEKQAGRDFKDIPLILPATGNSARSHYGDFSVRYWRDTTTGCDRFDTGIDYECGGIAMIKREANGKYLGIQCDDPDCEIMAPSSKEILAGFGLNNMGWHCVGGTHLCPLHAPPVDRSFRAQRPTERADTRHLP